MIRINLICVGKIKEKFYKDAIEEYSKRLNAYCNFKIVEVDEGINDFDIETEGNGILKNLKGCCILFDIEGRLVSSPELALFIDKKATFGESLINFVIGGSRGVSDKVRERADAKISFGRITLPHQLFRVVATEQIYRAFTILNNTNYHK